MVCRHGRTVMADPNDLVRVQKEGQAVRNEAMITVKTRAAV